MSNRGYISSQFYQPVPFIMDTLPNFLAGLSFPFVFYKNTYFKNYKFYIYSILIGLFLTFEEFYPNFSANKVFDVYDIIMSWVGCILAFIYYKFYIQPEE